MLRPYLLIILLIFLLLWPITAAAFSAVDGCIITSCSSQLVLNSSTYTSNNEQISNILGQWLISPVGYTLKHPIPISLILAVLIGIGIYRWGKIN